MKYAIFGDSFISRLNVFTNGQLTFPHECQYFGVPGMSTQRKFEDMFESLISYKPRYVFLNLGGNDIMINTTPDRVYVDILRVVQRLYENGVEKVFVASIVMRGKFPAWTGMTYETFSVMRRSINKKLKRTLKDDFIDMHKKLKYPKHYDIDLVHPGFKEGGMDVMKRTIIDQFLKTL